MDLTKGKGQTIAQGLAAKADVVIAAFKPEDDARLGVDAAACVRTQSSFTPRSAPTVSRIPAWLRCGDSS